jgi:N-acetylglutamate synthase-like GNAT family acetyltransferase
MAFKLFDKKGILHESQEFYIKEAGWRETMELHKLFQEAFTNWKGVPSSKFVLVAVDKQMNKVIGGIETTIDKKLESAEEKSFAVLPQFRDKGAGTALLRAMHEELRKMGIKTVTVIPTEKSWNIFKGHGYYYAPAMKAELRIRNLAEDEFAEGARLVKRL